MMQEPRLIEVKNFPSINGTLSYLENGDSTIPFEVKRIFWLEGMIKGTMRGQHAHKECHQFLVALKGGCKYSGIKQDGSSFFFRSPAPTMGLYVPPMTWLNLYDFEFRSVIVVFASHKYNEKDYIRDAKDFDTIRQSSSFSK